MVYDNVNVKSKSEPALLVKYAFAYNNLLLVLHSSPLK